MLFKGKSYVEMYNPFLRGYDDDAYFVIRQNDIPELDEIVGWADRKVELELTIEENNAYDNLYMEASLFRIKAIYQIHNELAKQLLYKKSIIEKSVFKEVIEFINTESLGNTISLQEAEFFIYGMDLSNIDYNKTPLSKLTYDIVKRER